MRHEAHDRVRAIAWLPAAVSRLLCRGGIVLALALLGGLLSQLVVVSLTSLLGRGRDERVREAEQRYQSLFEHHPDAVFVLDRHGCFSAANAVCQAVLGYTVGELVELSWFPTVVAPEDRAHAQQALLDALHGITSHTVLSLQRKDMRRLALSVTLIPLVIDGVGQGAHGIARDLSLARAAPAQHG